MKQIKTLKQLEAAWNELREEILSRPLFLDNSDKAKQKRKKRCENSLREFAKTYFPEYVSTEFAKFHKDWEKSRQIENDLILLMAFRGSGKSTFFLLLDPIHRICYGKRKFMIFSSYNEEKSAVFTGRILLELLYNPRIKNDFGEFFSSKKTPGIRQFTAKVPDSKNTVHVRAVSIGQDPRGLVYRQNRPDYARMDDIQSRKRAKSRKFVKESIEWITQDLIPALAETFSAIIVATPLNTQCVASTLEKGTDDIKPVKTYKYPAEKHGKPTWPEEFPKKRLHCIKEIIGSLAYNQEYLLIPTPMDERVFSEESIRWYHPMELINTPLAYVFSWTDPSVKHGEQHCYKATVCAGIDSSGIVYVIKARIRKESVKRMVAGMYLIYNECNPSLIFWEDNGGQGLLSEVFDAKAENEGYHLPHKAETNVLPKDIRIESTLSAPIENGIIRFNKEDKDQKILIEQLLQFPDGEFKDGPDALEGVVRKLFEHARKRRAGKPLSTRPRQAHIILGGY